MGKRDMGEDYARTCRLTERWLEHDEIPRLRIDAALAAELGDSLSTAAMRLRARERQLAGLRGWRGLYAHG